MGISNSYDMERKAYAIACSSEDAQFLFATQIIAEDFASTEYRSLYKSLIEHRKKDNRFYDAIALMDDYPAKCARAMMEAHELIGTPAIAYEPQGVIDYLKNISDHLYAEERLGQLVHKVKSVPILELADEFIKTGESLKSRHKTEERGTFLHEISVAFNEMCKKKDPSVYVKFGIDDIDNLVGTISPGNIVTIASKTGIGKSSVSLYPALRSAKTRNVMFVSTEMSRAEMMERCIAHISSVPMDVIKERRMSPFQTDLLAKALSDDIPNMQANFIDSMNTVAEIIQQVDAFKREGKPVRVLVVDHIGHIKPGGGYRPVSEYADIKESCKMLKNLALKNGIVIFMISQLNRMISNDQKPNLNHLKDCGEIEQISDKVLFMWRDSEDKSIIHFECGKNRSGESGGECVKRFFGSTMRYENV